MKLNMDPTQRQRKGCCLQGVILTVGLCVYNWVYCNSGSPYHSKELSSPTEKVSCTLTQQVTLHNQVYLDAHLLPPHGSLTDCSFSVITLWQDKCMNVFMERTLRQEANYFIQFFCLV
ncbi:hypothetical protein ATANTOWER_014666 [Ataeniobius toweri]|uniref:Uncharacterized protein n=1 Tax=Ataeniobius toweri TaxID=208326 RepID=A0ABU7AH20_9TELE|nr:hypothetical protein [Ataeniobius toweri]